MSEEFTERVRKMRHYAKQYWKIKQQEQLLEAEVSYEGATSFCSDCPGSDGDCCKERVNIYEEHWSDEPLKRFTRLMNFCMRHTTIEMIALTRPLNFAGVRDICDLEWPSEVTDYESKA